MNKKWWSYLIVFLNALLISNTTFAQPNVDDIDDYLKDEQNQSYTEPSMPNPKPSNGEHIALLLPLEEKDLSSSSELIQKGFELGYQKAIASSTNPSFKRLPIIAYRTTTDSVNILKNYIGAIQSGAKIIAGPITRSGANKISEYLVENQIKQPITLILNQWDRINTLNVTSFGNLYYFPFELEQEAKQIAQLAYREGKRKISVIYYQSGLNRKFAEQFAQEFQKLGGTIFQQQGFNLQANIYTQLIPVLKTSKGNHVEGIFYSADLEKSKIIKPIIDKYRFDTYTTNQVLTPDNYFDADLKDSKLTAMSYFDNSRQESKSIDKKSFKTLDQIRLFSFGYDAGKLTQLLQDYAPVAFGFEFDGLTGKVSLGGYNRFERELLPMIYTPNGLMQWNPDLNPKVNNIINAPVQVKEKTYRKPSPRISSTTPTVQPLVAKPLPIKKKASGF